MSSLIRKVISTAKAPAALGPYSQAVLVDRTIYISGQLGMDPASGQLVPGGVAEEAKQALTNIGEILKAAGCDFTNGYIIAGQRLQWPRTILVGLDGGQHSLFHNSLPFDLNSNQGLGGISGSVGPTALGMLIPRAVVKTTVLLADINDFSTVNDIYKEYFRSSFPARAAYQVAALPKGGRVEIEAVAVQGPLQTASL